ncbi:MAG TPA: HAD family acid phosphatase [Fimbriimonas sp.]|nr:HAD family acid phosphatase [Fimbriimonas sp.]
MLSSASLLVFCALVSAPSGAPMNLADAKQAVIRYHDSGRWDHDSMVVAEKAVHWIDSRAGKVRKPALVLDIDETALLNWPEERKTDFGYVADLWNAWEKEGKAPASKAILYVFKNAVKHRVSVFFLTGRREPSREGTARNLRTVGYVGYTRLILRAPSDHRSSAATYKAAERAKIEASGYRIIANIGDQQSDLSGGHSERSYKLPNPMYFIP